MTADDMVSVPRELAGRLLECDELWDYDGKTAQELADTLYPPKPEAIPDPDYRPPSVADGTIAPELVGGVQYLMDEYGPAGVQSVLEQLMDALNKPEPVVTDEMVEAYAAERWGSRCQPTDSDRQNLEAVERLGWLRDLESAADNPSSSSEPWPTDEQVLAAAKAAYDSLERLIPWESSATKEWWIGRARDALEAVAPPPVSDDLSERLAMAEGLLRAATYLGVFVPEEPVNGLCRGGCIGRERSATYIEVSEAEAEYLRSLDGEGDSDE